MKTICSICGKKIPVEKGFRKLTSKFIGAQRDPRIRHLKEAHDIETTVLGDYFVEEKPQATSEKKAKKKPAPQEVFTNQLNGEDKRLKISKGKVIVKAP